MKNRKLEYFTLCLSFLGWILLIAIVSIIVTMAVKNTLATDIISNIGTVILSPYILISQIVYYEKASSKIENSEKDTEKQES